MKAVALLALLGAALAAPLPNIVPLHIGNGDLIPDNYIAVFKPEVDLAFAREFSRVFKAERFFSIGDFKGFSAEMSSETLNKLLTNVAFIDYVEQDQMVYASAQQTNPPSWGIDRVDQQNLPLDSLFRYYDSAGSGVRAYILDTGIRTTHNDFGGRASFGWKANANWGESDGNGHGTHVASTTGGTSYGLAKRASLIGVKVLSDLGSGSTSGVIDGINWVANQGTANKDVANMSLGGGYSATMNSAVNAAVSAGIFFAVAAGNDNANSCSYSPASASNAMTVMATTNTDARASYSNYGTCSHIFAPGSSITAAWISSDSSTNTISGTSMASPHVCGCAALANGNSARTPSALRSYLVSQGTANKVTNPGTGSPNVLLYCPF
jgi:subtilisin family serine protease